MNFFRSKNVGSAFFNLDAGKAAPHPRWHTGQGFNGEGRILLPHTKPLKGKYGCDPRKEKIAWEEKESFLLPNFFNSIQ